MKKIISLFLLLFVALNVNAEEYVDGHKFDDYEITQWNAMSAPSVSPSSDARVYQDSTDKTLKLSLDGGAYSDIATAATVPTISGWTKTGTDVHLTTSTDNVGIGTSVPEAKLDIVDTNSTHKIVEGLNLVMNNDFSTTSESMNSRGIVSKVVVNGVAEASISTNTAFDVSVLNYGSHVSSSLYPSSLYLKGFVPTLKDYGSHTGTGRFFLYLYGMDNIMTYGNRFMKSPGETSYYGSRTFMNLFDIVQSDVDRDYNYTGTENYLTPKIYNTTSGNVGVSVVGINNVVSAFSRNIGAGTMSSQVKGIQTLASGECDTFYGLLFYPYVTGYTEAHGIALLGNDAPGSITLGLNKEVNVKFDSNDLIINTKVAGSGRGNVIIPNGSMGIGTASVPTGTTLYVNGDLTVGNITHIGDSTLADADNPYETIYSTNFHFDADTYLKFDGNYVQLYVNGVYHQQWGGLPAEALVDGSANPIVDASGNYILAPAGG